MDDQFDERDETERDESGADALGGGGPARTLDDDEGMDEADLHGDRLAGGNPEDRPSD